MSDQNVSIKIEADLAGNAQTRLEALTGKARQAADAVNDIKKTKIDLPGSSGGSAGSSVARSNLAGSGGNWASEFYKMRQSADQFGRSAQSFSAQIEGLKTTFEKLGQSVTSLSGSAAKAKSDSVIDNAGGVYDVGGRGSGSGKVGMGKRGLFNAIAGGEIGGYNVLASVALGGFAAHMAGQAASGIANYGNTLQNSDMTSGQKLRTVSESIPIIGSIVEGFGKLGESLSGLTENVRRAGIAHEEYVSSLTYRAQERSATLPYIQQLEVARSRANSTKSFEPDYGLLPEINNRYEYQRYVGQSAISRQTAQAQQQQQDAINAEKAAAQREQTARNRSGAGTARIREGVNYYNDHEGDYFNADRLTGLYRWEEGLLDKLYGIGEQRAAQEERLNAARQTAEATSAIRKSGIRQKQYVLEDVVQKEERLSGQYQSFGAMLPGTRGAALQAFRQAQRIGYESLGEHQRGLVKSLRPDFARKEEEKIGQKYSREFEEIRRLAPEESDSGTTLQGLREQKLELTNQINVDIKLDEQLLAKAIADKVSPLVKAIEVSAANERFLREELEKIKRLQGMNGAAGR